MADTLGYIRYLDTRHRVIQNLARELSFKIRTSNKSASKAMNSSDDVPSGEESYVDNSQDESYIDRGDASPESDASSGNLMICL